MSLEESWCCASVGLPPLASKSGGRKGKRGGASGSGEPRWQVLPQEPVLGSLGGSSPGSAFAAAAAAALHLPAALPPGMALGPMQQMLLEGAAGVEVPIAEGTAPMATQCIKALSLEPSPSGSISPFANAPAAQTSSEESDTESDDKQVCPPFHHHPLQVTWSGCCARNPSRSCLSLVACFHMRVHHEVCGRVQRTWTCGEGVSVCLSRRLGTA